MKVLPVVGSLLLTVVAASCGSADRVSAPAGPTGSSSTTFGDAAISPTVTPTGFLVTLEPSAVVDLICGEPASVHSATDQPELLGLVGSAESGVWIPNGPDGIGVMACLPAPSSAPATYRVPDELGPGDYILCRGLDLDPAGCATFTVVLLADSDDPGAVPLTTLPKETPVATDPPDTAP